MHGSGATWQTMAATDEPEAPLAIRTDYSQSVTADAEAESSLYPCCRALKGNGQESAKRSWPMTGLGRQPRSDTLLACRVNKAPTRAVKAAAASLTKTSFVDKCLAWPRYDDL